MNSKCATGTCAFHDNDKIARCNVCSATWYKDKFVHELREILADRPTPCNFTGVRLKADLISVLEDLDEYEQDEDYVEPAEFRASDTQVSDLQIGLHWDLLKHIRDPLEEGPWTESEELRFQFAVAGTLCHELVHAFWWHTRRHCWNCEKHDPWLSPTEPRHGDLPELGISWEHFAFGSRIPGAGKLMEDADGQSMPNIFQRCQWSWIDSTLQGGVRMNRALKYYLVVPVEYINAWFRESTWVCIAKCGREAGRPSQRGHQILRLEPHDVVEEGVFGLYECELESYSHQELVAYGGFNGATKIFLYKHRELHTENLIDKRISKLRTELKKKIKANDELERELDALRRRIRPPKKGSVKGGRTGTTSTKMPKTGRVERKGHPRKR
jgi:hypothetical protein